MHYDGAISQNCIIEIFLYHKWSKSVVPDGHNQKNFSFYFKCYNLTIPAVNVFEAFCTCSSNSLGQDVIFKILEFFILFYFFASWARNGRFEHFFEKNDLRPLEVNVNTIKKEARCTIHIIPSIDSIFQANPLRIFSKTMASHHIDK